MSLYVGTFEVKYNGPIHLRNFYREIHDWVVDNEFVGSRSGSAFPEIMFYESRSQPGGTELWIWWRPEKTPQDNPFVKYVLRISFHFFRMRDQEMMHNNRKYKFRWAENKVIITAVLETDYEKRWQNHPILKHFYQLFWKRIFWHNIEKHKERLLQYCYDLQKTVKAYYGSVHWEKIEKPFRPKWGIWEEYPIGP